METLIEINKKDVDGVIVFEFSGELDETNADKTFSSIYDNIGSFEGKKIILNFAGLKYLNSKSIGYIADIFSNIDENNGKMYICECKELVKDVLELVGITTIVPTVTTETEALKAINS
nr:STAS domain-containing protein [Candidatus Gracilibacteria bacterium]